LKTLGQTARGIASIYIRILTGWFDFLAKERRT
jgi:hypothetical protein